MKKKLTGALILILIVCMCLFLVDWNSSKKKEVTERKDIDLYYVSIDGTKFHKVPYAFSKPDKPEKMAEEALQQLKKVPENENCQAPIPQALIWSDIVLDDTNLTIDFTSIYSKLSNVKEIFLRSSVVKTLIQIDGITTVEFKLNGIPLMNLDDEPVGPMNEETFIDDSNANWGVNQEEYITLFYANSTGDALVEENTKIIVENNIPKEQAIIEKLIEGGVSPECHSPIPKGTKVLKTVIKNGTCYVDFNEHFLDPVENVAGVITIYSVVNSLVELPNVNKVQFMINGEKNNTFRDGIDLKNAFDRDLNWLENKNGMAGEVPYEETYQEIGIETGEFFN